MSKYKFNTEEEIMDAFFDIKSLIIDDYGYDEDEDESEIMNLAHEQFEDRYGWEHYEDAIDSLRSTKVNEWGKTSNLKFRSLSHLINAWWEIGDEIRTRTDLYGVVDTEEEFRKHADEYLRTYWGWKSPEEAAKAHGWEVPPDAFDVDDLFPLKEVHFPNVKEEWEMSIKIKKSDLKEIIRIEILNILNENK